MSTITTQMIDQLTQTIDTFFDAIPNRRTIDRDQLRSILNNRIASFINPNTERFFQALDQLPDQIDGGYNPLVEGIQLNDNVSESLFRSLIPWRKGPFKFNNFTIDSEWQSNMKWDRFSSVFSELTNKQILDIGCGNGYYMFRMLEHQPKSVLGIDPSDLTYYQFHMIQHFVRARELNYLPITWNDLYPFNHYFDVVFCMGILYHHRSPQDLLRTIRDVMNPKGMLMFDTLIIDGNDDIALFPRDRYAKMPNVYFLPTVSCLKNMFFRAGFRTVDILSIDQTTSVEQRATDWTFGQSLSNFLDPENSLLTIEGYPAPKRIALVAQI